MSGARLRALVRAGERSHGRNCSQMHTLVPASVLWRVAPGHKLHRDAFLNTYIGTQGTGRMGVTWCPQADMRGRYARAALYVASIGPTAWDTVQELVADADTLLEWDLDHPPTRRDLKRQSLFDALQGPWVLSTVRDVQTWVRRSSSSAVP